MAQSSVGERSVSRPPTAGETSNRRGGRGALLRSSHSRNQIAQAFRLAAPAEVPTVRRERTAEMEIRREREVGRAEVEAKREAAVEAEAEAEAKRRERAARRKEAEEPSRRV